MKGEAILDAEMGVLFRNYVFPIYDRGVRERLGAGTACGRMTHRRLATWLETQQLSQKALLPHFHIYEVVLLIDYTSVIDTK